ncbi:general stress protein [Alkalicoccus chagannorensis]|uniref:general stress protein n=1 Tax=Alkalicoccus chagannorensis TaxID=427072 RepID=UPI00040508FE|nr:general stress protein [Alkalicoccus chagannorensis]
MNTKIIGVYGQKADAVEKVHHLDKQHQEPAKITIIVDKDHYPEVDTRTFKYGVNVERFSTKPTEGDGLFSSLKTKLNLDDKDEQKDHRMAIMNQLGVSKEKAEELIDDVADQKFVVLVHDDAPHPEKKLDQDGRPVEDKPVEEMTPQEEMQIVQQEQQYIRDPEENERAKAYRDDKIVRKDNQ